MLMFYTTKCKEKFNGTENLKVKFVIRITIVNKLSYLILFKWYTFTK